MNSPSPSQSSVLSDFPAEAHAAAPATIPFTQQFYWSVRRELWENRSLYLAPLAVAALVLFGFLVGMVQLRRHLDPSTLVASQRHGFFQGPYDVASLILMGVTFVIAAFYCLDALYGERRDRSILFWKSLPVSDLTTVLSKITIPLVVLPLLTFVITLLLQACMLLGSLVIFGGTNFGAVARASHAPFFPSALMLLYHLIAIHGFWYAPIYAWLLLVSAWARRSPLLWAVLPPFGLAILEQFAFHTHLVADLLKNRFTGAPGSAAYSSMNRMNVNPLDGGTVSQFLASPGLWLGLFVAGIFLAGAVTLRRHRDPM
jgi:ABC-2 type transport system permease protein